MPNSPIAQFAAAKTGPQLVVRRLAGEFACLLDAAWELPQDLAKCCEHHAAANDQHELPSSAVRRRLLAATAARKFRLHAAVLQALYDAAAADRLFFSPQEKSLLESFFIQQDKEAYLRWGRGKDAGFPWACYFIPVFENEALAFVKEQLREARVNRSDARQDVQSERRESILRSLFGTWVFQCFSFEGRGQPGIQPVATPFSNPPNAKYGAAHFRLSADLLSRRDAASLSVWLRVMLERAFDALANHRCCTVTLDLDESGLCRSTAWQLIADATVFAERMREEKLQAGFFHPQKIREATVAHIPGLDQRAARFDLNCTGFVFKDCLLFTDQELKKDGDASRIVSIVLLFEKNVADETVVPCPACGSLNVRGNSYPVLGVKSWECQNLLCPERSAFDRGNRFTPAALERAALRDLPAALIPDEHIKLWKLDVLPQSLRPQLFEMLIRHFTIPGERILACNWDKNELVRLGRKICVERTEPPASVVAGKKPPSWDSPFFHRYLTAPSIRKPVGFVKVAAAPEWLDLYCGNCAEVLDHLPPASVDGAVTSPPYYNAREYTTWPNIYCYYHDMKAAAARVFEALKPGGCYLFNVFDYFDNENTVAFSAMGKRRIPLGAYLAQAFTQSGFDLAGNVAWFKGEIEGKRSCNQGSRIPFHQLPLNAWEHVLIFRKPGPERLLTPLPDAVMQRPVMKWVRGENRHGHTAPFPEAIPDLLCSRLPAGSTILDPFAGSLTTARTARRRGHRCIAIEMHQQYCQLGLELLKRHLGESQQLRLL